MTIRSECAQSGRLIELVIDSDLAVQVREGGDDLLVFTPRIDWETFRGPNIIDAY